MPAQVNATLVEVLEATAARGDRDDWDTPGVEPAGAGAVKWAGSVRGYYRERVQRVSDAGELRVYTARTLYLDTADYRALELDTNDVLTIDGPAGVVTGRAVSIAVAELAGVPRELATTRVELEPAP